jgi:hypothetical protein
MRRARTAVSLGKLMVLQVSTAVKRGGEGEPKADRGATKNRDRNGESGASVLIPLMAS